MVRRLREKTGARGHAAIATMAAMHEPSDQPGEDRLVALLGRISAACRAGRITKENKGDMKEQILGGNYAEAEALLARVCPDGEVDGGGDGRESSAALVPTFSSAESAENGRRMLKAALALGAAEAAECAICHDHIATALNLPCLHKFLCSGCSERFRADEGDVCFSCREPSTVVDTRGTLQTKEV